MQLAKRMSAVQASAIREILKVTERPEVLSFAGGLPAPEAFPVLELAQAHAETFAHDGAQALQYGPTEGHMPLRAWIAQRMVARGLAAKAEEVLVTAGSQQGIDLAGKTLLDPGDVVAVEAPSYLAALQSFATYEARFEVVGSDAHGMIVDELATLLLRKRVKLIYLVPNFQNPRGTTLSLERRRALVQLAARHGATILEDDPYGELRFSGEPLPPIAALGREAGAHVIHLGSFSKTLAPGLRLGFAVADEKTIRALVIGKQASDLHSGQLAQVALARLFRTFDYEAHLARLRALYGARCEAMLAALARHLPQGSQWTVPQGGLFVWAQLPAGLDAQALLALAMREKVAFVPGLPFYPDDGAPLDARTAAARRATVRLNFSNRPPALIEEGMSRLARCISLSAAA